MTATEPAGSRYLLFVLLAVIVALLAVAVTLSRGASTPQQSITASFDGHEALNTELAACIDRTIARIGTPAPGMEGYTAIWKLCETQMYDQFLLNDFVIRRNKFHENSFDERINMWLVVAITLSGVILAALQLVMSFQLAKNAKTGFDGDHSLVVEQGKLSFKSSVTGLMIMALSLLFFVVYVKWIYANYDVVTDRPRSVETVPPWQQNPRPAGKELTGGGPGPPEIARIPAVPAASPASPANPGSEQPK